MWFFWLITFLCCIGSSLLFVSALMLSNGAPQQAATGVMALCLAVIPYVATRCLEGEITAKWRKDVVKALRELVDRKPAP